MNVNRACLHPIAGHHSTIPFHRKYAQRFSALFERQRKQIDRLERDKGRLEKENERLQRELRDEKKRNKDQIFADDGSWKRKTPSSRKISKPEPNKPAIRFCFRLLRPCARSTASRLLGKDTANQVARMVIPASGEPLRFISIGQ